jgi:hypothetical protein
VREDTGSIDEEGITEGLEAALEALRLDGLELVSEVKECFTVKVISFGTVTLHELNTRELGGYKNAALTFPPFNP